eukprot:13315688-Alexandrium_andersonii.AAC.1
MGVGEDEVRRNPSTFARHEDDNGARRAEYSCSLPPKTAFSGFGTSEARPCNIVSGVRNLNCT